MINTKPDLVRMLLVKQCAVMSGGRLGVQTGVQSGANADRNI